MTSEQIEHFEQIEKYSDKLTNSQVYFWKHYSSWETWQFWFLLVVFVLSLIILYLLIDKRKALLLGFYGMNIHMWLSYFDDMAIENGLWKFPYKIVPFFPGFAIDAAFAPVIFILVYQWTLNRNKNYYIYAVSLSVFIAFLWRPFLSTLGLFRIYNGINYIYLFLGLLTVMLVSKWITNIFVHFQKESNLPNEGA
ncbi:hypothetical protein WQ54_15790 [Bacillus sp. SA1-12]|uniref:hypothetical protein n=1 Tax=Bacillus sp. SA1-12 TaxID=1455638 RepID=UPI00062721C3|nr:hypothetical protein [Bacillus sp. SA1-12]KKI91280.1 hypothetical protein WQ54_15790 [Bacillus sp. SA1-12]